jgi:hypothetical protein
VNSELAELERNLGQHLLALKTVNKIRTAKSKNIALTKIKN